MSRQRSWWIPWTFVGGFAVVLAVNLIMVFFAFDSWTGIDRANAYKDGLAYNDTLAAEERQRALGWTGDIAVTEAGDGRAQVRLTLADDDGTPMNRADVMVRFHRPTHGGADFQTALGWLGDGSYGAEVDLPMRGLWEVHVIAETRGSRWREAVRVDLR